MYIRPRPITFPPKLLISSAPNDVAYLYPYIDPPYQISLSLPLSQPTKKLTPKPPTTQQTAILHVRANAAGARHPQIHRYPRPPALAAPTGAGRSPNGHPRHRTGGHGGTGGSAGVDGVDFVFGGQRGADGVVHEEFRVCIFWLLFFCVFCFLYFISLHAVFSRSLAGGFVKPGWQVSWFDESLACIEEGDIRISIGVFLSNFSFILNLLMLFGICLGKETPHLTSFPSLLPSKQCPRHPPPPNLPPRQNFCPHHHARLPSPETGPRRHLAHRPSLGIGGWSRELDYGWGFPGRYGGGV